MHLPQEVMGGSTCVWTWVAWLVAFLGGLAVLGLRQMRGKKIGKSAGGAGSTVSRRAVSSKN